MNIKYKNEKYNNIKGRKKNAIRTNQHTKTPTTLDSPI